MIFNFFYTLDCRRPNPDSLRSWGADAKIPINRTIAGRKSRIARTGKEGLDMSSKHLLASMFTKTNWKSFFIKR